MAKLRFIEKVLATSSQQPGKIKFRPGGQYRLTDKDGDGVMVSFLGSKSGELVVALGGKKRESELLRDSQRLALLRKVLLGVGVADWFR